MLLDIARNARKKFASKFYISSCNAVTQMTGARAGAETAPATAEEVDDVREATGEEGVEAQREG